MELQISGMPLKLSLIIIPEMCSSIGKLFKTSLLRAKQHHGKMIDITQGACSMTAARALPTPCCEALMALK